MHAKNIFYNIFTVLLEHKRHSKKSEVLQVNEVADIY